ncbi:acyl-CoA dehydrogenase family protein, partial [Mycolicibacterium sp. CBMA 213]|uniref:acyl-CoA dehydrogenase family protein n=1 Tax=Mycolicibacterium sp. CBMA 213 TaxID=1968788 RepID=UPI0012DC96A0
MGTSALAITDEHNDLANAAIGLLQRLGSRAAARATLDGASSHPVEFWTAAANLGWQGLAVPEAYGGA